MDLPVHAAHFTPIGNAPWKNQTPGSRKREDQGAQTTNFALREHHEGIGRGSLFCGNPPAHAGLRHTPVGIVRGLVTNQYACVRRAIKRDWKAAVRGYDIHVEVDQPFAADGSTGCAHAVRGVACGTAEARIDVAAVLIPAGVLHNLVG